MSMVAPVGKTETKGPRLATGLLGEFVDGDRDTAIPGILGGLGETYFANARNICCGLSLAIELQRERRSLPWRVHREGIVLRLADCAQGVGRTAEAGDIFLAFLGPAQGVGQVG